MVEKYQGLVQSTREAKPPKPQTTATRDRETAVTEITPCHFLQTVKTKCLALFWQVSLSFYLKKKKKSVFHSADDATTNFHKLTGLNKKHLFFTLLEAGKDKIKILTDLGFIRIHFLDSKEPFSLIPHGREDTERPSFAYLFLKYH